MKDTNGCGPSKYPRISRLIPNLCFGDCCNQHDLDYAKGGDVSMWRAAESRFLKCMLKAAKNPFMRLAAHVYAFFTKLLGRYAGWKFRREKMKFTCENDVGKKGPRVFVKPSFMRLNKNMK